MQVVANYVAMVPNGKVFDSSLEKGHPYDIRIGTGQVSIIHCIAACTEQLGLCLNLRCVNPEISKQV